jgi:hypothetical protein
MNDPRPEMQSAPRGWTTEIDDGTIDQAIAMLDEPEQLETDVTFYAPEFKSLLRTKTLGTKIARSLVKAAHRQQYQRVERDVAKSMLEFFRAQTREVTKKLFAQDWTPDPEHAAKQAKKLVAKAFDEDKWNEELVTAAGQPMADAFIEGAVAEIGLNNAAKRRKMQAAFNPDQPRDEAGRWAGSGGGGSESGASSSRTIDDAMEDWFDYDHSMAVREVSRGGDLDGWTTSHGESLTDEEKEKVRADAEMIQRAAETTNSGHKLLYRGIATESDIDEQFKVGKTIELDSLTAASPKAEIALIYAQPASMGLSGDAKRALLHFENPKGNMGLNRPDGAETILPKGAKYRVSRVRDEGGLKIITLYQAGKKKSSDLLTKDADDFDDEYGDDIDFPTEMPAWLREAAQDFILETFQEDYWLRINETTRLDIEGVLYRAIEDGMSIRDIAKEIQERTGSQYSRARATNVARTETTGAMSRGHISAMHEAYDGIDDIEPAKEWLSVLGTTTRDEHADADGQQVAVDADFTVGGEACSFPGDARLSAGNRCNCQCTIVSAFVGEGIYDDEGERGFDPNQARDEQGRWTGDGGGRGSRYEETDEEGDIISDWQGTGHASMRRADAEGKMTPRLKKFLDYMSKEPKFAGIAYRGVALPEKEVEEVFKVGRKVGVDGVQSFSTSRSVASRFASAPIGGRKVAVLLKAKVKDGRSNIRNNPTEREVIVRRENFKVKSVKESTSNWGEKMYVVELH